MTHTEDINRVRNLSAYLMRKRKSQDAHIQTLEKKVVSLENKIEFLQAQLEVAKEAMFNKYK